MMEFWSGCAVGFVVAVVPLSWIIHRLREDYWVYRDSFDKLQDQYRGLLNVFYTRANNVLYTCTSKPLQIYTSTQNDVKEQSEIKEM